MAMFYKERYVRLLTMYFFIRFTERRRGRISGTYTNVPIYKIEDAVIVENVEM